MRALLKMKEGSVYSPKQIREDSKKIADAYGSGGYVDLQVTPQGVPAGQSTIDVKYTIEEGSPSFVQRINIVGNTRTKDKVIRREVLIAPGDIFNSVRVETTKKRLDNLGYFSKVETYPEDTGVSGRKDLTIQVEEKRTGSLNFGAGFSTVDKLVGFVEMTQGNFDLLNWPNFTGAGQKFRVRIQYGTSRKDFVLSLTEPYFLDRRLSLGGQIFFNEADYLQRHLLPAELWLLDSKPERRSALSRRSVWGIARDGLSSSISRPAPRPRILARIGSGDEKPDNAGHCLRHPRQSIFEPARHASPLHSLHRRRISGRRHADLRIQPRGRAFFPPLEGHDPAVPGCDRVGGYMG